jgi:molecular chaperone GrpE
MRSIFGKARKPMSDSQQAAAGQATAANSAAQQLPYDAVDEGRKDPLSVASEAAAEHVMRDAEGDGREDVTALQAELDAAKAEVNELKDRWLRLNAEFDNFRKRNAKERMELIQFAGENVLKNVLPVVDDMERAIANNDKTTDINVMKEGFLLIHSKLLHIIGAQGVKPMTDIKGQPFDVDRHEAITKAPAPEASLKGKVLEVVENGFTLHDKVIRYAKVVVGE